MATFSKTGVTTFTFPKGNKLPISHIYQPNQIVGVGGGGNVKVATLGSLIEIWTIVLERISKADHDLLVAFFSDTNINWQENTFTWTDELSIPRTVRLWEAGSLNFPIGAGLLRNIQFKLRTEP